MRIHFEKHAGYSVSIYEADGKWRVQPVLGPDDVPVEGVIRKPTDPTATSEKPLGLIDMTGPSEWQFGSLEKAKSAAHNELERVVGGAKAFDAKWEEKG